MCNAIMDTLADHFNTSIFTNEYFTKEFWNKNLSWKNKYKERGDSHIANLIEKLDDGPLVFLTDGWHMFQMFWRVTLFIGIILARYTTEVNFTGVLWMDSIIIFGIISTVYLSGFVLFYNKVLVK
jgi:hypothetical protein